MNTNMLWQLLQNMNESQEQECPLPFELPPPLDTLCKIRHVFSPKEQRIIDILIKWHELQVLLEDM